MKPIPRARAMSLALILTIVGVTVVSCQDQLPDRDGDGIADVNDPEPDVPANPPPVVDEPDEPPAPPSTGQGKACIRWSNAYKVGQLQTNYINEASGLEFSSAFPDRLYHINDSGDGPYVYISDKKGASTRRVKLNNTVNRDSEDLTLGPCPDDNGQCLVFGDIGDGGGGTPILTFVRESEFSKSTVNILSSVKITLETGEVDLEGMALHPNGDLFLATKDYERQTTRIMRVPKASLLSKTARANIVANIDLSKFRLGDEGALVTSFDISPDGKSFLLLTYSAAVEVVSDLGSLTAKTDLTSVSHLIKTETLGQQEALAYIDGGNSFLYDTEDSDEAPLMRIDCLERASE